MVATAAAIRHSKRLFLARKRSFPHSPQPGLPVRTFEVMKRSIMQEPTRNSQRRLDEQTVREIAVEADVDERTLLKRIVGLPVRGRTGRRIDAVLARRGL